MVGDGDEIRIETLNFVRVRLLAGEPVEVVPGDPEIVARLDRLLAFPQALVVGDDDRDAGDEHRGAG